MYVLDANATNIAGVTVVLRNMEVKTTIDDAFDLTLHLISVNLQ